MAASTSGFPTGIIGGLRRAFGRHSSQVIVQDFRTNHLHLRGEHAPTPALEDDVAEPPPPARRALQEHLIERAQSRTTSACAESTDPNHSAEIDRAHRLFKYIKEAEREGFHISIKASQHASHQAAGNGVLSRLFGREATEAVRELPEPVGTKSVAEQMGIMDAEIVEGREDDAA